jgi:hypothetical protein
MATCDLCGAEVSPDQYCHLAAMPSPVGGKDWFLLATDSSGNKERVNDSEPSFGAIAARLSQTFSTQSSIREAQADTSSPANLPSVKFAASSGKLFFCHDCVGAHEGKMTNAGVAYARGKARIGRGGSPITGPSEQKIERIKVAIKESYRRQAGGNVGGGVCHDCRRRLVKGQTYLIPGNQLWCESCTDKFLSASYIEWPKALRDINAYFGPGLPSSIQDIADNR